MTYKTEITDDIELKDDITSKRMGASERHYRHVQHGKEEAAFLTVWAQCWGWKHHRGIEPHISVDLIAPGSSKVRASFESSVAMTLQEARRLARAISLAADQAEEIARQYQAQQDEHEAIVASREPKAEREDKPVTETDYDRIAMQADSIPNEGVIGQFGLSYCQALALVMTKERFGSDAWRGELQLRWINGADVSNTLPGDWGCFLRQVRNSFGPRFLEELDPTTMCCLAAEVDSYWEKLFGDRRTGKRGMARCG